jgi:hypothetical protein
MSGGCLRCVWREDMRASERQGTENARGHVSVVSTCGAESHGKRLCECVRVSVCACEQAHTVGRGRYARCFPLSPFGRVRSVLNYSVRRGERGVSDGEGGKKPVRHVTMLCVCCVVSQNQNDENDNTKDGGRADTRGHPHPQLGHHHGEGKPM